MSFDELSSLDTLSIKPKIIESKENYLFAADIQYEIDDVDYDELEIDVDGSASLRVYHTPALYSDWTVGSVFNYRPDNKADQYKDFYVTAALNYDF